MAKRGDKKFAVVESFLMMEKDQPIECPSCKLLKEQIENQREQLEKQAEQIRKLEERLGLHSQNSSKPPSSDQKKNKQAPRGGAKKGHRGHFRQRFPEEQITHRVRSEVTQCERGGCQE